MIRLTACLIPALLSGITAVSAQEPEPFESSVSAVAQPAHSLETPPKTARLDFDFRADETKAWINQEGDFQIQGWVRHAGLACATYRVGVRFGNGSPGCLNVKWLGEPRFVTSHLQCNNARVSHAGGDRSEELGAAIDRITCAERVVRCTGNCR